MEKEEHYEEWFEKMEGEIIDDRLHVFLDDIDAIGGGRRPLMR